MEKGLCLLIGVGDGQLGYELAKQSQMKIIGIDTDVNSVKKAREKLQKAGFYGTRISILPVSSYEDLPFPNDCANLIVAGKGAEKFSEIISSNDIEDLLKR